MPSSQIQTSGSGPPSQLITSNGGPPISKPPPPNKPPPPPPLPAFKPTTRPPPPPPRNSSQLLSQSNVSAGGQLLCGTGLPSTSTGGTPLLNNGSSMSSINSAGRCNHVSPGQSMGSMTMTHNQRNFLKHGADNYSSRSSVSSHSSLQHHHLQHMTNNGNGGGGFTQQVTCGHQPPPTTNMGCICSGSAMPNTNSSTHSDYGSCNHVSFSQDNRGYVPCHNGCCGGGGGGGGVPNHHAQLHQLNPTSKCLPSLPPVDSSSSSSSFHRCHNMSQSSSTVPPLASDNQLMQRPLPPMNSGVGGGGPGVHCNHVIHRTNGGGCAHHHQANFCDHHIPSSHVVQHQQVVGNHECGNCSHSHGPNVPSQSHHDCGLMMMSNKTCANGHLHHHHHSSSNGSNLQQELLANTNRSLEATTNDSLLSSSTTAHTHNLSNSSTTTHTSNVAVKHQPHFHGRPPLTRNIRSNSSQQYDQYGLSSAASTSSATASLSSYQMPLGYEDLVPLYPNRSHHQQLPPPLPPTFKSRPASPAITNTMLTTPSHLNNTSSNNSSNNNNSMPFIKTQFLSTTNNKQESQQFSHQSLPPLPPKPLSPNASSTSTQITTLGSSPSLLSGQPITRVTSQAGVQNPLPSSDIPPPLPPSNPGSRQQPLVNTLMTKINHQNSNLNDINQNPIPNFINLNINQRSMTMGPTEAERKTEALTRQVELELEQQQKSGEPLGVCAKCGDKVMMAQDACKAMNKIYHATCFVCCECNRTLLGKTFYPVGDRVYCEEDFNYTGHMQSLEKCAECTKPIFDMILPAMGKSYHPECFKCCVCSKCLDGVPFTIDAKNKIYCVSDYHNIYSPKCAACGKSIAPIEGTSETVRVVSLGKDYHIDCFCCEDCGMQLTDDEPSKSYPLDDHPLCQQCHINRLSKRQFQAIIGQ